MHVRASTKRQNGKTYRYAQFVQSYRRSDGVPAHRVVANLGAMSQQAIDNLKLALKASREGKNLVVADDLPGLSDQSKICANLGYLDVVVMLAMWRGWGLDDVLADLLHTPERAAQPAEVTAALVLHRCIAPGSKLYAQRWLPTTALPEVLGLQPAQFNNTRLHRVLDELYEVTPSLQERLAALYRQREGSARSFFIDVTDTFFEGRGCELAQRAKTKEGRPNKWSIGIVLLADERGYPWRWQVVASKTKDHQAMGNMLEQLKEVDWLRDSPLVCDRAMGQDVSLRRLQAADLRFLTAAPVDTIETYTTALPYPCFAELKLGGTKDTRKRDIALVVKTARKAGLVEIDEHLFVLDLGIVELREKGQDDEHPAADAPAAWADKARAVLRARNASAAQRLRVARELRAKLASGEAKSQAALARQIGVTPPRIRQTVSILRLAPDLQEQLLAMPDVSLPERQLRRVAALDDYAKQREMLADLLAPPPGSAGKDQEALPALRRLRVLAYFNPQMFVDKRRRAHEHLAELRTFVEELNDELSCVTRSRKEEPTRRKIVGQLEKHKYLNAFEVDLDPIQVPTKAGGQVSSFRCRLGLKEDVWERRHRYHGFVLLLGHPELSHPAEELAALYREKDVIEKDFETIKSVLKMRPIYSHTDPKVQAHVTICMLALLLNRTVERRLRKAGLGLSPAACLEILSTCHLNRLRERPGGCDMYSVTEPTTAQREILEGLDLGHLVDDAAVARSLLPQVVST